MLEFIQIQAGISGRSLQGGDDRVQGRLAGQGGHGGNRAVDDINACLGTCQCYFVIKVNIGNHGNIQCLF